jgi:hypothetical protein
VRRIIAGLLATVVITGTFVVLPVYAAPLPQAEPVAPSAEDVALGSVAAPAPEADVQKGTTEPVAGVPTTAPVLTLQQTDVDPFSMVGVSWAYDRAVTDTVVQVRVRDRSGKWGNWIQGGTERAEVGSDAESATPARGGTEPLWTGPSDGVEVEIVTRSGARPTDVRLDLIDPGKSAADSSLETPDIRATADAAMAMPPVYSRLQWGADESLRHGAVQYASTIKAAVVHHTAGSNDYSPDQVPAIIRGMYAYHTKTLGWADIGYNALVDKYGRIWEGRYGGLSRPVVGAHAGGFNTYTFGVSMIGNYDVVPTTQPLIDSVANIIGWKLSLYGVDPHGTTALVSGGNDKYKAGTVVKLPTIFGHRDTGLTACPGRYGYAKLPEIRTKADGQAANASFVRALYKDMMGRGADERGVASWTGVLAAGGSRRAVSNGFAKSTEYRGLIIRQAYQQVLGREPDPRGVVSWMNALATGTVRLDTIRLALMSSAEFYARGGNSNTTFVNNIFQAALGRNAAPAEVTYWSAVRATKGAAAVIHAVWGAPEAGKRRVEQAYQYYLGRSAGGLEREHWLPVVAGAGDEQLREEIVASYEYFARSALRFP